jgi:hypothetical protein
MTELTVSIIQKVKDELDLVEDLPSTELYDQLYKYRNSQHPDKFIDTKTKVDAGEKFKTRSSLLSELSSYIEKEKQQKKPSELIVFEKDYEAVKNRQQVINYEDEINQLKELNNYYKIQIETLNIQILKLQGDKVQEKTDDLIKHYSPSKKSLFSQGIVFILTLIIAIISKVEVIAESIKRYFPFDQSYFNIFIFSILTLIPIRYFLLNYQEKKIENTAKRIRTPLFISKFVNYLTKKEITDIFTEMNVFDFLSIELAPKGLYNKIWETKIFNIYSETTIDTLKDIFIFNLLNRQLITISIAEHLDRKFKITKKTAYYPFID